MKRELVPDLQLIETEQSKLIILYLKRFVLFLSDKNSILIRRMCQYYTSQSFNTVNSLC